MKTTNNYVTVTTRKHERGLHVEGRWFFDDGDEQSIDEALAAAAACVLAASMNRHAGGRPAVAVWRSFDGNPHAVIGCAP